MTNDWADILEHLQEHGGELSVSRFAVPHPRAIGMRRGMGLPKGQRAHWRLQLKDGSGLHVHEHDRVFNAHVDRVDPRTSLVGHLRHDVGPLYIATVAVAGAVVGHALGGRQGAAVGAMAGAVLGTLTRADAE